MTKLSDDEQAIEFLREIAAAFEEQPSIIAEQFVLPGLRQFIGMMVLSGVEKSLLAAALRQVAFETDPTEGTA